MTASLTGPAQHAQWQHSTHSDAFHTLPQHRARGGSGAQRVVVPGVLSLVSVVPQMK